jgi:hypothetical protein
VAWGIAAARDGVHHGNVFRRDSGEGRCRAGFRGRSDPGCRGGCHGELDGRDTTIGSQGEEEEERGGAARVWRYYGDGPMEVLCWSSWGEEEAR